MSLEVVIVGRPNVGKSTLFNRLVGKKLALVDDRPGVTRDRRKGEASLGGLTFTLVDTAGLDDVPTKSLEGRMRAQTEAAIDAADVCLFLVDARAGVTPLDRYFANVLRRRAKPVILLANKAESSRAQAGIHDAYGLGLGEPIAVSAEHGQGLDEVFNTLKDFAGPGTVENPHGRDDAEVSKSARSLRLAIVGRPNVGKSTLVNALLGEERMLTGPEAGITRDAVASNLEFGGRRIKLWDTAGLRRKARVSDRLEKLSVADALRAVRFAEVVVVVVDATMPFEKQDLQIADLAAGEGRALVIAVNKWDEIADKQAALHRMNREVEEKLSQVKGVPMVAISALRGQGLDRLMKAVLTTYDVWNKRVATAALNRWLEAVVERHPPPAPAGRRIKIRYMTQANARPPTFAVFCSNAEGLPASYLRYLSNSLREKFGFPGVPIRIVLRQGRNPYAGRR
jgi:GTP-binding protein